MNLPCAAAAFLWRAVAWSGWISCFWTSVRARPDGAVSFAAAPIVPARSAPSSWKSPRSSSTCASISSADDWGDSRSTSFSSLSCSTTIGSTVACARNLTRSIACRSVGSESRTVSRLPRLAIGRMRLSASSFVSIRSFGSASASIVARSISGRPKVSDAKRASLIAGSSPLATSSSMNIDGLPSSFCCRLAATSAGISLCCTSARASPGSATPSATVPATLIVPPDGGYGFPRRRVCSVPIGMDMER